MAHRDSRKRTKAAPSSTRPQVCEADAIGDAEDFDLLVSQAISELESVAKSMPESKAELEAAFGSMDAATARALEIPEIRKLVKDEIRAAEKGLARTKDLGRNIFRLIINQLADVPRWEALATSDPKKFRTEIAGLLQAYKKSLNSICGIKSHRPKNDAQNSLIYQIKASKPNWSFGQVAREYSRRTGKPMTAKTAERTYSRTKPNADYLLDFGATESLPMWKWFQNTAKASGLLRRKSSTT
jgi:hypothetical protein